MAYSNRLLKGVVGFNSFGWGSIIIERAKSDKPNTPVLCEVFGIEQECGSMYVGEFTPAKDMKSWENRVKAEGHDPKDRYFKGELLIAKEA